VTAGGTYDLAIIGAGINGAGIARDAALRGLSVVVLEKDDLCSGCSAISSRLIHGGLRYLEYGEIPLVYESLHERRNLLHDAPHLVRPLRICIPVFTGAKRGPLLIRLGMMAYDLLSIGKSLPHHATLSRDEMISAEPGLRREGLRAAACYYDAQVDFAERLVLENLLSAREAGAEIRTHCEVTAIRVIKGRVVALECRRDTGDVEEIPVRAVINAAGPWVDRVLETAPVRSRRHIGGTKGSHIIVGHFDGAPGDAFYVEAAADGRPFFIIPWNGLYLIGTTDIRYDGDLDTVRASAAEVDYLLAETNRVFPGAVLGREDIHYAYAGVRPLPARDKGPESAITRRHIISVDRDVAEGLVSIVGGKLTTYRHLAEEAVDALRKVLRRDIPRCPTHSLPLPGARSIAAAREALLDANLLSAAGVERLLAIYGGRAAGVLELCQAEPGLARTLDPAETILAAEVAFALREEFAGTLIDIVFRRMMVGLDADQGRPLYGPIADVAALQAGWSEARKSAELDALVAHAESFRVH